MPLGDCDCDVCELDRRSMEASEKHPAPNLHAIPDVRRLPLADRRAVFLDGLRALTQMTGVYLDDMFISLGDLGSRRGTYEILPEGGMCEWREDVPSWTPEQIAAFRAKCRKRGPQ